jgi:cation transport regulator ChaB
MPTTKQDLPGTLKRSPKKAQETFSKTLDSAHERYDSEQSAHRAAYASLKHGFEKVGDHWEPKDKKGPSDAQAKRGRNSDRKTAGGVDVEGHTKEELLERARKLDIKGRSKMDKAELGRAIARKQD